MKTPLIPGPNNIRLRLWVALLLLLTGALGFILWPYRQANAPTSSAEEESATPSNLAAARTTPTVPVWGSIPAATGNGITPTPSATVSIATHPEENPAWAVPYGQEFWRPNAPLSTPKPGDIMAAPSFEVGEVMERVSHAFVPGDAGSWPQVHARVYSARFDEEAGLGFSPHRPAANLARPQPEPATEAWFRTAAIARNDQTLFTAGQDKPQWSLLGNTAQGLLSPAAGLVAHYEARAHGVEVTWVLPQEPAGTGPLVVEAELNGLTYAAQTEHGAHYADATGVARVRVGSVTVVDATGRSWGLGLAAAGNRLRLEVTADILSQATYPLAIDPVLEAEFEIDKPVILATGDDQTTPAVAASGGGYLVAWYDASLSRVIGARVTAKGQVSDPRGITIERSSNLSSDPAVAASSSGYLVVWSSFQTPTGTPIYGARVTTAGIVSDPNPIVICTNASSQPVPSVAASGSGYLVVWGDQRNDIATSYDIYGTRVTAAGVVVDSDGIAICTATNNQAKPSVTANNSGYLVVWEDDRNVGTASHDIYGARVTTGGVVSDMNGIAICTNSASQTVPSAAASGSGYLVVWQDDRNSATTTNDIYGARVTTAGVVSDPNGIAICTNSASQTVPAVAANASSYLVVWQDSRTNGSPGQHIYGTRLTTAGVVSEPNGIAISTSTNDQFFPAVAASSSGYLVAWQDTRNAPSSYIYAARLTPAGAVSDTNGIVLNPLANDQYFPAVAASSNGYLVVWQDDRNSDLTSVDIYGARVTTAGLVSDPNGLAISTAVTEQALPEVAANGSDYLVVWRDSRNFATASVDIYGARVTGAGVVLDTNGIAICTATNGQASAVVAASSNGYLVVWVDARNIGTTGVHLYGARVTTTGVVLDTNGIAISMGTNNQTSPAVAASSDGYFVVWSDDRNNPTTADDIYGTRVTSDGVVLETNGIAISTAPNDQHNPAVAASSSGYLVVWEDDRNIDAATYRDIYGTRVTTDGFVSETNGIPICTLNDSQENPSVAAAPEGYVVVWTDVTSDSLFWHRLNFAGEPLESTPLTINGSYQRGHAATAYGGAGRFLLVSDAARSVDLRVSSRLIGSLHASTRPSPGPILEFKAARFTVLEDKALATITVTATGNNPGLIGVDYATADGTAVDGIDYEGQEDTLFFPKGTKQQTFTIPIIANSTHGVDRTINLVLSRPTGGATLGLKRRAVLTILDDDPAGTIGFSAAAYTVRESTHMLTITVKRLGGTASGVTVAYETGGGTAVADSDYASQAGTLSFEAGDKTNTFTIPIFDNLIKEGKKTFFMHVFNPTGGATLGPIAAATVTILDDD